MENDSKKYEKLKLKYNKLVKKYNQLWFDYSKNLIIISHFMNNFDSDFWDDVDDVKIRVLKSQHTKMEVKEINDK